MSAIGISAVRFVKRFTETARLWISAPNANRFVATNNPVEHLIDTEYIY